MRSRAWPVKIWTGLGAAQIGFLMVCTAAFLACRVLRVPATLPVLAIAMLLLQVGAIGSSP